MLAVDVNIGDIILQLKKLGYRDEEILGAINTLQLRIIHVNTLLKHLNNSDYSSINWFADAKDDASDFPKQDRYSSARYTVARRHFNDDGQCRYVFAAVDNVTGKRKVVKKWVGKHTKKKNRLGKRN
eukprot:313132_1